MIRRRSRYHMLQLAEELAVATNKQLTLMERNNVVNYEDYLLEWMPIWYVLSKVKLIMLVALVFNMQCMHIGDIV